MADILAEVVDWHAPRFLLRAAGEKRPAFTRLVHDSSSLIRVCISGRAVCLYLSEATTQR